MLKRKEMVDLEGYCSTGVKSEDLEPGEMKKIKVIGQVVVLTLIDDQIYAFDRTCPHGAANLTKGSLSGSKISCPDHGYCFDVRSGRIIWPENENYRLRKYLVKVEEGQIRIRLDGLQKR